MSDSLQPHGLQHTRLPCPSPSPGDCSDSCPLSWWCHPTVPSSVTLFCSSSSCLHSFPASGSFPMSQLCLVDFSRPVSFFFCMVSCAPFVSVVSFLSSSLAFTALSTESLFQLLVLNSGPSHPARAPQTPNTCLWSICLWVRHSSIILSWEARAVGHMLLSVGCVFIEALLSTCRVPVPPCPLRSSCGCGRPSAHLGTFSAVSL